MFGETINTTDHYSPTIILDVPLLYNYTSKHNFSYSF